MATKILKAPIFVTVRSESGTVSVDNATVNDTNYPQTNSVQPFGAADTVCAYWDATAGTPNVADTADIQVLLRDASRNKWILGETKTGVLIGAIATFSVQQCTEIYFRIVAVALTGSPEGLIVRAASILRS